MSDPSVCIILPTIGQEPLVRAVESCTAQTYENVKTLIVIDGQQAWEATMKLPLADGNIQITCAPENTGGGGFYGHRIYAAYPHLVNADYIAFLDEDNWFEPNHIETLVEKIESRRLDWAFSFRKIYTKEGEYVADDCCESLGKWPIFWSVRAPPQSQQFLVDTSSYCFRRDWLIQHCQQWHSGWGGDRRFFNLVRDKSEFDTTALHTLNYRLDDQIEKKYGSIDFFAKGNEILKKAYGDNYPWENPSSSVTRTATTGLMLNIGATRSGNLGSKATSS